MLKLKSLDSILNLEENVTAKVALQKSRSYFIKQFDSGQCESLFDLTQSTLNI